MLSQDQLPTFQFNATRKSHENVRSIEVDSTNKGQTRSQKIVRSGSFSLHNDDLKQQE